MSTFPITIIILNNNNSMLYSAIKSEDTEALAMTYNETFNVIRRGKFELLRH